MNTKWTPKQLAMRSALLCLHAEVAPEVAKDVGNKVMDCVNEMEERHSKAVAALKLAYVEINTIHARCGVPWWPSGKSDVTQEHFTHVVETARAALDAEGAL